MSTIPDIYKGAGYGTIYSDSEARQAIANAEVEKLIIGGGGSIDPAHPNAIQLSDGTNYYKALSEGTPADGVIAPTGGSGAFKWLSGIYNFVSRIPALGQALVPASIPVVLPVSQITTLTPVSGGFISSATIQRANNTTPYTANDVYGAAFELQNIVGSANGNILLTSIDIILNFATLPNGMGAFTLFLYSVTPPSAIADNGAFSLPSGDRASILTPTGIVLGSAVLATGGGSVVLEIDNLNLQFKPVSTSLFGYLVTSGAFTPAANSETATIRARVLSA